MQRGNSSTVVLESLHQQRFYEKTYLARRQNHVMGEKEMMPDGEGDGILRLHQCLAMICVRKVKIELVACYISVPDSEGGRTKLHMSKNDDWGAKEKQHVHGLLEYLGKMRKEFTIQNMDSRGCQQLRNQIQNQIYNYCKQRLQHKINLLLKAIHIGSAARRKDPKALLLQYKSSVWMKLEKEKKLLLHYFKKLAKYLKSKTKSIGQKSNSYRQRIDQARGATVVLQILEEKEPKIYQCIQKVASYCKSVDVLVNWALGTDKCLKAFPVPEEVIFSTSVKEPPPEVIREDWEAIAKTHYGNNINAHNLKHVEQHNPLLQRQFAEDPPKRLCLHAEMQIVDSLAKSNKKLGKQKQYIGVSKLCCYICYSCIHIRNQRGSNIIVQGTQNKIYCAWRIPKSVAKKELKHLEKKIDRVNLQNLKTYKEDDGHESEESVPVSIPPRLKARPDRRKEKHGKSRRGKRMGFA